MSLYSLVGYATPLSRLAPQDRIRAVVALLAIVVLFVAGVVVLLMTGRFTRRVVRRPPGRSQSSDEDWSTKPLSPNRPKQEE